MITIDNYLDSHFIHRSNWLRAAVLGANDGIISISSLAIGVAAATGILAIISQYATIREAEVLLTDLKRLDKPSELSKKIADSRHLLSLSAIAIVGLGIAVFTLVVWAVLG